MRSVAILGFSPLTLPFVKNSKADEYWSLNHVFLLDGLNIPRVDRLFELHKRTWYLRGEQQKSKKYSKWLKKEHPFPIYMQEAELNPKLIPSGVRYPLEEICKELLSGLVRVDKDNMETIKEMYFTSTVAFMMALAIYEKFDQIELYGVDMDSDTEWGYQKPCGEFWVGIALGRGIKVIVPEPSSICSAPVYGYEVVPYIDKLDVNAVLKGYQEMHGRLKAEMDKWRDEIVKDPENEKAVDRYLNASAWVYMYEGAITACSKMIQIKDSYVSRQFIEINRAEYLTGMEFYKGNVNQLKGKIAEVGRENVSDNDWRDYLTQRANMFANLGAAQTHTKFMKTIDFRKVDWNLSMDIVEREEDK